MVSVIVPIYNAGKYISATIDSLLAQTYQEYELILVNNNSTDDSRLICESYLERYPNVSLIDENKQGVAAARNAGINNARGEYIIFVDADDISEDNYIKVLVDEMNKGYDMVVSGYKVYRNDEFLYEVSVDEERHFDAENYLVSIFDNDTVDYQGFIWDKMFRTDIIKNRNIRFAEDVHYNEDRLFVTQYVSNVQKICYITNSPYRYIIRDDSATGSSEDHYVREIEFDELKAFDLILKSLHDYPKAYSFARKNMAEAEIRLFRRMLSKKDVFRYRKSVFRKFAKRFDELKYEPKTEMEGILIKKLSIYSKLGITYSSVDVTEEIYK